MRSSSPVRTLKLQLAAEQPLTGECWIPPIKDTLCQRTKEKPQKDHRRDEIALKVKPPYPPEEPGGLKQNFVCTMRLHRD